MKDLEYWYQHTSNLGFERMIRERLPLKIRFLTKIYIIEKFLDLDEEVIKVYYSFKNYADLNTSFCCEFSLGDLEIESKGYPTITKKKNKVKRQSS